MKLNTFQTAAHISRRHGGAASPAQVAAWLQSGHTEQQAEAKARAAFDAAKAKARSDFLARSIRIAMVRYGV